MTINHLPRVDAMCRDTLDDFGLHHLPPQNNITTNELLDRVKSTFARVAHPERALLSWLVESDPHARFDWVYGAHYTFGAHPERGGGEWRRDVADVILDELHGYTRQEWIVVCGKDFVAEMEDFAMTALEP